MVQEDSNDGVYANTPTKYKKQSKTNNNISNPELDDFNPFSGQYEADPSEAFAKQFEKLHGGFGPAEELLKTGGDIVELIVRARIPTHQKGAMITLLLKADCDEMIELTGRLRRSTYRRMAAAYTLAVSIGESGLARREYVTAITADLRRSMYGDNEPRKRGFFGNGGNRSQPGMI